MLTGFLLHVRAQGPDLEKADAMNVKALNTVVAIVLDLPRVPNNISANYATLVREHFVKNPDYGVILTALKGKKKMFEDRVVMRLREFPERVELVIGVTTGRETIDRRLQFVFAKGQLSQVMDSLEVFPGEIAEE
jgi:hypothetical protein